MRFPDGEMVTNSKIILFLKDEVLYRELRGKRFSKAPRTNSNGEAIKRTLNYNSIEGYVSSLMSLWQVQYAVRPIGSSNEAPNRNNALKNLLRNHRTKEASRRREQYMDRGVGTLLDGYTIEELRKCVRYCWSSGHASKKRRNTGTPESYLRTVVDLLFGHSMLLRGESRRMAELPDLFTIRLPHAGTTPCWAMLLIMDNGKTNHFGKLQYGTVVRNKDPYLCLMGQLAFYLFYRWKHRTGASSHLPAPAGLV